MTRITIRMNNSAGEVDSRVVHVEDAKSTACGALLARTLIDMINDNGLIYPGDSFTVEGETRPP